jgi:hypothetical protein
MESLTIRKWLLKPLQSSLNQLLRSILTAGIPTFSRLRCTTKKHKNQEVTRYDDIKLYRSSNSDKSVSSLRRQPVDQGPKTHYLERIVSKASEVRYNLIFKLWKQLASFMFNDDSQPN